MDPGTALVTGASRGIGRAIAAALAARGQRVFLVARDAEALEAAAAAITASTGALTQWAAADLRAPDAAQRLLDACRDAFGAPSIVINNAGTAPTARFEKTDDALLDEVLDLHLRAPLRLLRAALPDLRAAPHGTAVQVASTAGLRGFAYTTAYTAAKHAMVGMTRALAEEFGPASSVRTYAVCPGFVETDLTRDAAATRGPEHAAKAMQAMAAMNRIGRMHRVEEVADAVVDLIVRRPAGTVLDLDSEPPCFVESRPVSQP